MAVLPTLETRGRGAVCESSRRRGKRWKGGQLCCKPACSHERDGAAVAGSFDSLVLKVSAIGVEGVAVVPTTR